MRSTFSSSRRRFLAGIAAAGLVGRSVDDVVEAAQNQGRGRGGGPNGRARSGKKVLTQNDLTFQGAFVLPLSIGAGDPQWGLGLTHRYVGAQLRFLSKAHGNPPPAVVYEVAAPPLSTDPQKAQTASLVRVWGDVAGSDSYGQTFGLFWDEREAKLYWSNGNTYNTQSPFDPSVGVCTFDNFTGNFSRQGVWGFTGRSCKMAMGGVLAIPQWFSDVYCPGQRLGAGFGGYFSIATVGPVSMGPALTAFDPLDLARTTSRSSVNNTPLIGYPFNGLAYTTPDRCHRDTDYQTEFDGWNPKDNVGYWSWSDFIWQAAVWIDTPTRTGLVFFPTIGNGRTWYEASTLHAERASHWWYVYDPADLAMVAEGQMQQWQAQPANRWPVQYAGVSYPLPGWSNEPAQQVIGATFDASAQMLYVAVRFALGFRAGSPIVVYGYSVA